MLRDHEVNAKGALVRVDNEDKLYDGEHPYVVISLDGLENDDYKNFTPTAATAAQLDKFYNLNDGASQPPRVLADALRDSTATWDNGTPRQRSRQAGALSPTV